MFAVVALSLILLITSCGPRGGDRPEAATAKSGRGPEITKLTITPTRPAPGDQATGSIVIRDDQGVVGFRVIVEGRTKDISCDSQVECSRTFTRLVPQVSSPTLTVTIIAENTAGERTRVDRTIALSQERAGPVCGNGACEPGEESSCPSDCEAPTAVGGGAGKGGSEPPAGVVPTGDLKAFFRSGFESGVTLGSPEAESGAWVQFLSGSDQGYDWSRALPQRSSPRNRITYLVSTGVNINTHAVARLETVTGRDGKPTRALYMELKKEDPSTKPGTRVQFGIYPDDDLKQAYVRYWLKLQPDLASAVLPPGTKKSRQVMEWKETGKPRADFRWGIYIRRDRDVRDLFWFTRAQYGDLQRSPDAWDCTSRVPVPVGEWFLLEVFWKLDPREGRVWAAANGKTFVDYKGATQKDSPLFVWWPFKVYVGTALENFERTPLYQWVDDVEFAREPPVPLDPTPRGDTYTCRTY